MIRTVATKSTIAGAITVPAEIRVHLLKCVLLMESLPRREVTRATPCETQIRAGALQPASPASPASRLLYPAILMRWP